MNLEVSLHFCTAEQLLSAFTYVYLYIQHAVHDGIFKFSSFVTTVLQFLLVFSANKNNYNRQTYLPPCLLWIYQRRLGDKNNKDRTFKIRHPNFYSRSFNSFSAIKIWKSVCKIFSPPGLFQNTIFNSVGYLNDFFCNHKEYYLRFHAVFKIAIMV